MEWYHGAIIVHYIAPEILVQIAYCPVVRRYGIYPYSVKSKPFHAAQFVSPHVSPPSFMMGIHIFLDIASTLKQVC